MPEPKNNTWILKGKENFTHPVSVMTISVPLAYGSNFLSDLSEEFGQTRQNKWRGSAT